MVEVIGAAQLAGVEQQLGLRSARLVGRPEELPIDRGRMFTRGLIRGEDGCHLPIVRPLAPRIGVARLCRQRAWADQQ